MAAAADRWRCPSCSASHEKPPQLRLLGEAAAAVAVGHQKLSCPSCGRAASVQDILDGRLDDGPKSELGAACWFCGGAPERGSWARARVSSPLGGEREIPLPRCASCRSAHDRIVPVRLAAAAAAFAAAMSFLAFLVRGRVPSNAAYVLLGLVVFMPCLWFGMLAERLLRGRVKGLDKVEEHPAVRMALSEGCRFEGIRG